LEFVRQGWSIKSMHRLMMTSSTYRQSSAVTPERDTLDPGNDLFSRMPMVRLDAEALYDSLLCVADRLDERRYGPGDPVQVRADGLVTPSGTARGWRRLIYVQQFRKQLPTSLEVFDYPQMNPNCIERRDSTVATQALYLMNNTLIQSLCEDFARRVIRELGDENEARRQQRRRLYLTPSSRCPSDEEKRIGLEALAKLSDTWAKDPSLSGHPEAINQQALKTYCHAIMNSAGFLYVD